MVAKKKADLEALVLKLLKEKTKIGIHDVAQAAGLSKSDEGDRKAIRRVLTTLVERGLLEAKGAARARVYVPTNAAVTETSSPEGGAYKTIQRYSSLSGERDASEIRLSIPPGSNSSRIHSEFFTIV